MTVKKKTLLKPLKEQSPAKAKLDEGAPPSTAGPNNAFSMRRIVAKKLAAEKLVAAKRLN